jgi:hypothetical protein
MFVTPSCPFRLQMLNATEDEQAATAAAANSVIQALHAQASNNSMSIKDRSKQALKRTLAHPHNEGQNSTTLPKRRTGSKGEQHSTNKAALSVRAEVLNTETDAQTLPCQCERVLADAPMLQGFQFLAMEEAREHVLLELQPVFVILYDLNLEWVRLLEVYQSMYPERPVKVGSLVVGCLN